MTIEFFNFLRNTIRRNNVSAEHSETSSEYSIETDSGDCLVFECRYGHDDKNRPAEYCGVYYNGTLVEESFFLESEKHHSNQTRHLIELIECCRAKALTQEIKSRKTDIQQKTTSAKVRK